MATAVDGDSVEGVEAWERGYQRSRTRESTKHAIKRIHDVEAPVGVHGDRGEGIARSVLSDDPLSNQRPRCRVLQDRFLGCDVDETVRSDGDCQRTVDGPLRQVCPTSREAFETTDVGVDHVDDAISIHGDPGWGVELAIASAVTSPRGDERRNLAHGRTRDHEGESEGEDRALYGEPPREGVSILLRCGLPWGIAA